MLTSKETECLTPAQRRIANSVDGAAVAVVSSGKLYILSVLCTAYLDWGFSIDEVEEDGFTVNRFSCPCYLSSESYGFNEPEDGEDEGEEWTAAEWQACLHEQSWDLLDGCLPEGNT